MYYKLTDPQTSTSDWIKLNTDSLDRELLIRACGDETFEGITHLNPSQPENEDEYPPELYGAPLCAWNTHWTLTDSACEKAPELRKTLDQSGFEMFETSGDHPVEFFFGVDGAGYSFIGAHWIPLRLRLASQLLLRPEFGDPQGPANLRKLLSVLEAEASREGELLRSRCKDVYETLEAAEAAGLAVRKASQANVAQGAQIALRAKVEKHKGGAATKRSRK